MIEQADLEEMIDKSIHKVFNNYFGLDLNKFEEHKKIKRTISVTPRKKLEILLQIVSEVTGEPVENINSGKRHAEIVQARHLFNYVARKHLYLNYTVIGTFINRDHSTIVSSCENTDWIVRNKGARGEGAVYNYYLKIVEQLDRCYE